jgi:hypothetical protein
MFHDPPLVTPGWINAPKILPDVLVRTERVHDTVLLIHKWR